MINRISISTVATLNNRDEMTYILIHINPTHPSNIRHSLEQLNPIPAGDLEPPLALSLNAASGRAMRTSDVPQKPRCVHVSVVVYHDGKEVGEAVEVRIAWFEAERDGRCKGHVGEEKGGHIGDYV